MQRERRQWNREKEQLQSKIGELEEIIEQAKIPKPVNFQEGKDQGKLYFVLAFLDTLQLDADNSSSLLGTLDLDVEYNVLEHSLHMQSDVISSSIDPQIHCVSAAL